MKLLAMAHTPKLPTKTRTSDHPTNQICLLSLLPL